MTAVRRLLALVLRRLLTAVEVPHGLPVEDRSAVALRLEGIGAAPVGAVATVPGSGVSFRKLYPNTWTELPHRGVNAHRRMTDAMLALVQASVEK